MPRCEVCGVELPTPTHRLVMVCDSCKEADRERRRTARVEAERAAGGSEAPSGMDVTGEAG